MKVKHCLAIKVAIGKWIMENKEAPDIHRSIICAASRFNWQVFIASKVEGDTLRFLSSKLYPYLTMEMVAEALTKITGIEGVNVKGGGA
jgi:hypothetical protein